MKWGLVKKGDCCRMPVGTLPDVSEPPVNRSNIRMFLGKSYFTWRRRLSTLVSGVKFATEKKPADLLTHVAFRHRTPLLRQLRSVDMWLQHNKVINLRLAAHRINGVILKPGETFSFWVLVGKPTRKKGYVDGMILQNGSFYPGVGGGLCQMSNLIYWMSLHTPLAVVERWRHCYDVFPDADRTQPFGSGATVFYNYVDLQIHNGTDRDYQLLVWVGDTHLHGEWRCEAPAEMRYEVYEAGHAIRLQPWGRYTRHNVIRRRVFNARNDQVGDEYLAENHAIMMYGPLLPAGQNKDPGL